MFRFKRVLQIIHKIHVSSVHTKFTERHRLKCKTFEFAEVYADCHNGPSDDICCGFIGGRQLPTTSTVGQRRN